LPLRAGTTVVFGVEGEARYVIAKPMPSDQLAINVKAAAEDRVRRIRRFVGQLDSNDPVLAFGDPDYFKDRMKRLYSTPP
jgi:hypothetical protein